MEGGAAGRVTSRLPMRCEIGDAWLIDDVKIFCVASTDNGLQVALVARQNIQEFRSDGF